MYLKRIIAKRRQFSVKSTGILGLGFGIVLGASGLAIGQNLVNRAEIVPNPGEPSSCESNPDDPITPSPSKLPEEWIWKKKAITFDHMYRTAR
ncbi:MAG: hypothetical protein GY847_07310 [Proteobacteria bacterium]|nr:hypothetical protein [Pseudomonadota bacterium]